MNPAKSNFTRTLRLLGAPLLALMMAACGGTDDPDWSANVALSVATTPLAGVIGGVPWELSVAEADAQLSNGSELFVMAYGDTPSTSCGVHIGATSFALLTVPTAVGEYAFSPTISATFVLNDRNQSNLWATRGKVIVESVTEAEVIARAFVEYDSNNRIDGRFTITVCK